MKIILTDSPKNCPEQLPDGYDLIKVDGSTIKRYDGNEDVAFVLCTRGLAATLVNEDIHLPSCRLVQLFSVGYDDVDVEKYQARDLPLCNAAGVYDNVLAEYVESQEQKEALEQIGCLIYQGYLFSPAVDRESLLSMG